MPLIIFLISLIIFCDSIGYAVYEINNNNNKIAGISVIAISVISLILPTIMSVIR